MLIVAIKEGKHIPTVGATKPAGPVDGALSSCWFTRFRFLAFWFMVLRVRGFHHDIDDDFGRLDGGNFRLQVYECI